MSWASRRQFTYLLGVFLFFGLIAFAIIYPMVSKPPTCMDGKKNGDEVGTDCGGVCQRLCSSQVSEPVILWSRAFRVTGSMYNLVAYAENSNKDAAVARVNYEFRIYDTNNKLLGRRLGSTYVPPNQQFAIFEPRFDAGQSQIKSVTFEFTGGFNWFKKAPVFQTMPVRIDRITLGEDKSSPILTAQITNESIYDLPAIDVIAILYDSNRNAITASKTLKESLRSNETSPLLFTWPEQLSGTPVTQDVFVQVDPFSLQF